jgi:ankyrin repeat protein
MPVKKKKIAKKKKALVLPPVRLTSSELNPVKLASVNANILIGTVAAGDQETFQRLVKHFEYASEVSACDSNGSTALHMAAKRNDLAFLVSLLALKKIDVNALEKRMIGGYTAVHHACANDNSQAVLQLLQAGAIPNISANSDLGDSPLHLCCRYAIYQVYGAICL